MRLLILLAGFLSISAQAGELHCTVATMSEDPQVNTTLTMDWEPDVTTIETGLPIAWTQDLRFSVVYSTTIGQTQLIVATAPAVDELNPQMLEIRFDNTQANMTAGTVTAGDQLPLGLMGKSRTYSLTCDN